MITEEVCGTTSMVHTHSQSYDMNRNEIVCVDFLSFISRFCRSPLISTEICCGFFSRTNSAEKGKYKTDDILCPYTDVMCGWENSKLYENKHRTIPFRTKQRLLRLPQFYFFCY